MPSLPWEKGWLSRIGRGSGRGVQTRVMSYLERRKRGSSGLRGTSTQRLSGVAYTEMPQSTNPSLHDAQGRQPASGTMSDADGGIPSCSQRHADCVAISWPSYPCRSGSWTTCTFTLSVVCGMLTISDTLVSRCRLPRSNFAQDAGGPSTAWKGMISCFMTARL